MTYPTMIDGTPALQEFLVKVLSDIVLADPCVLTVVEISVGRLLVFGRHVCEIEPLTHSV